ncbi:hypothetical protein C0J52_14208, partial [Blattella germanica]
LINFPSFSFLWVLFHHKQLLLEISFQFRKCLCALLTFISKTLHLLQLYFFVFFVFSKNANFLTLQIVGDVLL